MSHILDLSIVACYGYITGLFVIGFTRIVVTRMSTPKAEPIAEVQPTTEPEPIAKVDSTPDPVAVITAFVKPVKRQVRTANKAANKPSVLVIPIDEPATPELTLDQLKEEAKQLKIKGYNFYKDAGKLAAKIKEVKGS